MRSTPSHGRRNERCEASHHMGGGLEVESIPSQGMRTRRSEAYHHIGGGLEGEKHPITLEEDWKVSSIPLQGRRTGRVVASLHREGQEGKKCPFTEEDWKRSSIPSKGRRTGRREASLNRGGRFLHPYNPSLYRCLFDGKAVLNHLHGQNHVYIYFTLFHYSLFSGNFSARDV